jgi:hypothetical protein
MNTLNIESRPQPKELGYEAYARFGAGTCEEWVQRILDANLAAGIPNYDHARAKQTFDRLTAQYETAWKAKAAIAKHEKFSEAPNGTKGRSYYSLTPKKLKKAKRDANHFFIMPTGKNHAGRIVYSGRGRVKKKFHFTGDDYSPKPGSMRDLFGWLRDDDTDRIYFFKSEMSAQIERVLREHGHLDGMDAEEEVREKVESVWNIGRLGKHKRGFFREQRDVRWGGLVRIGLGCPD